MKTIRLGLALSVLLALMASVGAQEVRFFRIGTGGPQGVYYVIGGVLAEAISSPPGLRPCRPDETGCGIPGVVASALSTAGSVTNIQGLLGGQFDSALAQADVAYDAYHGGGAFAGEPPATSLRAIAMLYPETLHIVARAGSGIHEAADLRGKRVALDEPGSGTLVAARLVLEALGIGEAEIQPVYVKHGPALALMRQGELDAMVVVGGDPMPPVYEAIRELGATLIPLQGPAIEALLQATPFFVRASVEEETYPGMPQIPTIAVPAGWFTTDALPDELAHELTRVLFDPATLQQLREAHPQGAHISIENALDGMPVPVHPGAARFYEEQGIDLAR